MAKNTKNTDGLPSNVGFPRMTGSGAGLSESQKIKQKAQIEKWQKGNEKPSYSIGK